jgi:hypothetical protein
VPVDLRAASAFLAQHGPKIVVFALVPITGVVTYWVDRNPWPVAWLLAPVLVLEAIPAWRWVFAKPASPSASPLRAARVGWTLTAFVAVYLVLAGTPLCTFPESTPGVRDDALPRNWLCTSSLAGGLPRDGVPGALRDLLSGDWRYALAGGPPERSHVAVVLLDAWREGTTDPAKRQELKRVVAKLHAAHARAVALDMFFLAMEAPRPGETAEERERNVVATDRANESLCDTIVEARDAAATPMPVFFGLHHSRVEDRFVRHPEPPKTLVDAGVVAGGTGCLRRQDEGHLIPYEEADGVVRSVPLGFGDRSSIPPLAVRVAQFLAPERTKDLGAPELLQFPKTSTEPVTLTLKEVFLDAPRRALLENLVVFVGVRDPNDEHLTPFAAKPVQGVMLHAYAAEAILNGRRIHRAPWWVSVLGLLYPCFSLAGRAARGDSWRTLLASCAAVSALYFGMAALAMNLALRWVSVVEPLLGLWLFLPLVLLARGRRAAPEPLELEV